MTQTRVFCCYDAITGDVRDTMSFDVPAAAGQRFSAAPAEGRSRARAAEPRVRDTGRVAAALMWIAALAAALLLLTAGVRLAGAEASRAQLQSQIAVCEQQRRLLSDRVSALGLPAGETAGEATPIQQNYTQVLSAPNTVSPLADGWSRVVSSLRTVRR